MTFGELLLRLSPPSTELFFQSSQLRWYFGGSEANVAASLAHFGAKSEYVTCLPDNAVGDAALAALRAEGIDTSHIVRGGNRLGIYFVEAGADVRQMRVVYDRAGSSFSEMPAHAIQWTDAIRGADRLHISGITPALSDAAGECVAEAVAAARAANVRISIDLNFRSVLWRGRSPLPLVRPLATQCDVIIGNQVAIGAMLGIGDGKPDNTAAASRTTAERVADELGCATVAITRRNLTSATEHGWSADIYDSKTKAFYSSRQYQVVVVDRVGGGDAFAAGLIYSLAIGRSPAESIEFAAAAGALKLTIPGDFNRVSPEQVETLLASSKDD